MNIAALWAEVYPNLIASALWAVPVIVAQHLLTRWYHRRRDRHLHAKIDRLTALVLGDNPDTEQKRSVGETQGHGPPH